MTLKRMIGIEDERVDHRLSVLLNSHCLSRSLGILQTKFAASSILPGPTYRAFGKHYRGTVPCIGTQPGVFLDHQVCH